MQMCMRCVTAHIVKLNQINETFKNSFEIHSFRRFSEYVTQRKIELQLQVYSELIVRYACALYFTYVNEYMYIENCVATYFRQQFNLHKHYVRTCIDFEIIICNMRSCSETLEACICWITDMCWVCYIGAIAVLTVDIFDLESVVVWEKFKYEYMDGVLLTYFMYSYYNFFNSFKNNFQSFLIY